MTAAPSIYHYNPHSGIWIGQGLADPDPLTPGQWLYPAHSTTQVPPTAPDGYIVAWQGTAWALVPHSLLG